MSNTYCSKHTKSNKQTLESLIMSAGVNQEGTQVIPVPANKRSRYIKMTYQEGLPIKYVDQSACQKINILFCKEKIFKSKQYGCK